MVAKILGQYCGMINQGIVPEVTLSARNYVLLVEKDTLQRHLLRVSLEERGWSVSVADTPCQALRLCEHDLFDVAIINSSYDGEKNGFVFSQQLSDRYHLPSLMITASRYVELRQYQAFSFVQSLLFKPYVLSRVTGRLSTLTKSVPQHQL